MDDPKILHWLGKRAGLNETETRALWESAVDTAKRRLPEHQHGTPVFWQTAVEALQGAIRDARTSACAERIYQACNPDTGTLAKVVDLQTYCLVHTMLAWKDVAVASTRAWSRSYQHSRVA